MIKKNAAFVGGGISTVAELGLYSRIIETKFDEYSSFSGASIGAVVAICLAAGKHPLDVKGFLIENVYNFCAFIKGRKAIEEKTNAFLENMLYKNLSKECICSITPLNPFFPKIITRENSENLTVGEVAAMSSALPGLFLPVVTSLSGRHSVIFDGGITLNPPFNEETGFVNDMFKFNRVKMKKKKMTPWRKVQKKQESRANKVYNVDTITNTRGTVLDILIAYEEGKNAFENLIAGTK